MTLPARRSARRPTVHVLLWLLLSPPLLTLAGVARPDDMPCWHAAEWAEADLIFRRDPHWAGADGAFSVDLGGERTLWLFADTWIDRSGRRMRRGARMIRNSVGIQTGRDPVSAGMRFFWGSRLNGDPDAFFSLPGEEWYWPGHGIRLDDRLILFQHRLRRSTEDLGFATVGWGAMMIGNPDDDPPAWRIEELDIPDTPAGVTPGFASVLRWQQHVYAFGAADPVEQLIYAVRWKVERMHAGDLSVAEWWAGDPDGWVGAGDTGRAVPIFANGQSELTIHFDERHRQFVATQTVGFGAADVALRVADHVTGPWSQAGTLYRPPEYRDRNIMIYAAKAHPQLTGADLVLTYATNSFVFADHISNEDLYYPRFVRVSACRHGPLPAARTETGGQREALARR